MSIIRERQIKQIRDEDNRIRKIVYDREKQGIKDYEENIKPSSVLDVALIPVYNGKIQEILTFLNEVYIRTNLIVSNEDELTDVLGNTKGSEYRKYISLINIVKPFGLWEKLMNDYVKPETNEKLRETIINGVQKLTPYLNKIIPNLIEVNDKILSYMLFQDGEISEGTLTSILFGSDIDSLEPGTKEYKYIKDVLKKFSVVNMDQILKEQIEAVAFYRAMNNQIVKGNLRPITKEEITFEILEQIREITINYDNSGLTNEIIAMFKNTEIPSLAPYFKGSRQDLDEKFNELDAMAGMAEERRLARIEAEEAAAAEEEEEGEGEGEEKEDAGLIGESEEESEEEPEEDDEGIFREVGRRRQNFLLNPEVERQEAVRQERIRRILGQRRGEGKPKKGRRKYIKKNTLKRQTKPAIGFNDENNEMFYSSESESN